MRLLPREEKFYGLFLKQGDILWEAARRLLGGVRAGNSTLAAFAMEINVLEHRGDELIHEIFTRLNQTFLTPLDPADIHNISSSLDNVLDGLEDTSHRLLSYHIDPIPPSMIVLAEIVRNCRSEEHTSFEALEAGRPLMEHCI